MLRTSHFDEASEKLQKAVEQNIQALDGLRKQVAALPRPTRIQPRTVTTVSLVGTDGGHNQTGINPFLTQFMRVVDSNDEQHALEVIHSQQSLEEIWANIHRLDKGRPKAIAVLVKALGLNGPDDLTKLSPVFAKADPLKRSTSWLQVYRHITEWAVLYQLIQSNFASDTLFLWDGPLRTKVFPAETFRKVVDRFQAALDRQLRERNRKYYIAGITQQNKVLEKFRLAMALEGVMRQSYPCYVRLTGDLIKTAIQWIEYLSPLERLSLSASSDNVDTKDIFSAGQMYFVKFGNRPTDSVWAVDIWQSQISEDQQVFGYLLQDALDGFPVPLFPQCLQRAHNNAALVDFDMEFFNNEFGKHLRKALGHHSEIVDELELQDINASTRQHT